MKVQWRNQLITITVILESLRKQISAIRIEDLCDSSLLWGEFQKYAIQIWRTLQKCEQLVKSFQQHYTVIS
jgi:hypothetical protein